MAGLNSDSERWKRVYAPVVRCADDCTGIINYNACKQVDDRYIPRGFYSEAPIGAPVIMFLSMNPGGGRGQLDEPKGYYKHDDNDEVLRRHHRFLRDSFRAGGGTYYRRLRLQASTFLDLPTADAFRMIIFTELFKCTTPGNGFPNNEGTIDNCVSKHLVRELEEWRPIAIVTLANKVAQYVANDEAFRAFPTAKLRHPNAWGATDAFIEEARHAYGSLPRPVRRQIDEAREALSGSRESRQT